MVEAGGEAQHWRPAVASHIIGEGNPPTLKR